MTGYMFVGQVNLQTHPLLERILLQLKTMKPLNIYLTNESH